MGFYAQKSTTGITWKTRNISDTGSGIEVNNKVIISHKITLESDEKYVVDYEGTDSTKEITGLTSGKKYTIKATVKDKAGNIREARKEIYFQAITQRDLRTHTWWEKIVNGIILLQKRLMEAILMKLKKI